jgi:hypothetical protein
MELRLTEIDFCTLEFLSSPPTGALDYKLGFEPPPIAIVIV